MKTKAAWEFSIKIDRWKILCFQLNKGSVDFFTSSKEKSFFFEEVREYFNIFCWKVLMFWFEKIMYNIYAYNYLLLLYKF